MEQEKLQTLRPSGKFDELLLSVACNKQMYDFLGGYVNSSLYKMMRQDEIPLVERALQRCREKSDCVVKECIHFLNRDGDYDVFYMSVSRCLDGSGYYIELQNTDFCEKLIEKYEKERILLRDFLTFSGEVCFLYKPGDDSFSLFMLNYEQEIALYSMPFAEWESRMLGEGRVDDRDTEIFHTFCEAVRHAFGEQTYRFRGSILSGGRSREAYRVKFTQKQYAGETIVEGIWMTVSETTGDVVDDYTNGIRIDPLAKILNKQAINECAKTSLEKGENPAIIIIDIDDFKNVNDTYGHPFGDKVITSVAEILRQVVGSHGLAGRVGGDEFLVYLKDYGDEPGLRNFMRGIRTNVSLLFQEKVGDRRISCSIGIARGGIDSNDFKELYRIADRALYIAKQKGRNRYVIYKPELHGRFNTLNDDQDMERIKGTFYGEKDLNRLHQCLADLVLYGSGRLNALLAQAGYVFGVKRIYVFWGQERNLIGRYCTMPEKDCPVGDRQVFEGPAYRELFQDDMLQISNTGSLEYSIPQLYKLYMEQDTRSLMQHYLRGADGEIKGFISLEETNISRGFPKLVVQLFSSMCRVINAVLLREIA